MRKSTIIRAWLGGLAGIAGGVVAILAGTFLMLAYGGTWSGEPNASEFAPSMDAFFWWMVALISIGAVVVLAGGIAQLVAWIGALVNTYALADRTWFIVLLLAGVAGLVGLAIAGLVAMIVYLLVGPDSTAPATAGTSAVPPPVTLAPAS
ncbi:MAG: hypothetical protein E6J41_12320 [Chloroflexi bacterium]|nr:MAG: hypothetical protein E6J41_12320 [Chloroflexota bacterium]